VERNEVLEGGYTPLLLAVKAKSLALVCGVLTVGHVRVGAALPNGWTAVDVAAFSGSYELLRFVADHSSLPLFQPDVRGVDVSTLHVFMW
jgi:hypothetical protein